MSYYTFSTSVIKAIKLHHLIKIFYEMVILIIIKGNDSLYYHYSYWIISFIDGEKPTEN